MVQSRSGTRFPAKALQGEGVPGQLIGKEFPGNRAPQFLVLRLETIPIPPLPNL